MKLIMLLTILTNSSQKQTVVYLFIWNLLLEMEESFYIGIVKIVFSSVRIPDMLHLCFIYPTWLGQSEEEEEKVSSMRLHDYFEKSRRRGRDASASLMDAANEHDWRLTKYSQCVTECNYTCFCVRQIHIILSSWLLKRIESCYKNLLLIL